MFLIHFLKISVNGQKFMKLPFPPILLTEEHVDFDLIKNEKYGISIIY